MLRDLVRQNLEKTLSEKVKLERPNDSGFGDFSTNFALVKKINPQDLVEKLKGGDLFEKIEVAGPGFINFTLSKNLFLKELSSVLKEEEKYGSLKKGDGKKIQVEFVSANPTGPLTVANFRGGPYGDTLVNVLNKAGYRAKKAYYVNNYGGQIFALGHSVLKDDEAVYKGEYIDNLNKIIKGKDVFEAGKEASKIILEDYIKPTVLKAGIKYDNWIYESELHDSGLVDDVVGELKEKDLLYEKEGAKWFKSTEFGDNRDRVLVKSDDKKTYLAGDIALHKNKFENFDKAINVWGADHHGDVPGLMAGVEAIGYKGKLEILLHQFVTILEKGEKKRMSKRQGLYVTVDELLDKAGKDAVRFFFLQHSLDTHMNFDIELAKEQSNKNPVYYVQYAYARICNILNKTEALSSFKFKNLEKLKKTEELGLIKKLVKFPEVVEDCAGDYQLQRLPAYAMELAGSFHKFYENCKVLTEDKELTQARLNLIKATKIIFKNTFKLMGIEALEKM